MKILKKKINTLNSFEQITRFRLINAFLIAVGMNLFIHILIDLKCEILLAWFISVFMIVETIMIKLNEYFIEKFTMDQVYKMTIFAHLISFIIALSYFWSPTFMIYAEAVMGIVDIAIFSAFTIQLNNHIAENYPKDMSKFQIFRNSTWADGMLLGLGLAAFITFVADIGVGIISFAFFSAWLIYNWNFIKIKLQELEK